MGVSRPPVAQTVPCLIKHYDKTSFFAYNIVQDLAISPCTYTSNDQCTMNNVTKNNRAIIDVYILLRRFGLLLKPLSILFK